MTKRELIRLVESARDDCRRRHTALVGSRTPQTVEVAHDYAVRAEAFDAVFRALHDDPALLRLFAEDEEGSQS